MYEAFFGLQRRPFSATPDPDCLVPSGSMTEALSELTRVVENALGVAVLAAPAGLGKTLACRKLAATFQERMRTVFLATGNFTSPRALLQAILFDLGRPYAGMDEQELRLAFRTAAEQTVAEYQSLLIIIDEAHLLDDRLLEEVRLMSDLLAGTTPLVRTVLSGQLALEERLASPSLDALNQRIGAHVNLHSLTRAETRTYIAQRLEWSGSNLESTFTPEALDFIARACDGIPRCINQLSDHSLLLAYVADQKPVELNTIQEALSDLKQLPLHWNPSVLEVAEPTVESLDSIEAPTIAPVGTAEASEWALLDSINTISIEIGAGAETSTEVVAENVDEAEEIVEEDTEALTLELPVECESRLVAEPSLDLENMDLRYEVNVEPTLELPAEETVVDPFARLEQLSRPAAYEAYGWSLPAFLKPAPVRPSLAMAPPSNEVAPPVEESTADLEYGELIPESMHLEEMLGAQVLEICVETQKFLEDDYEAGSAPIEPDLSLKTPQDSEELSLDDLPRISRFDVVQPDDEFEELAEIAAIPQPEPTPKPSYKRLFSMLRRRENKPSQQRKVS